MPDPLKITHKLSGENSSVWQVCLKAILLNKGFWDVANPEIEKSSTDSRELEHAMFLILLAPDKDQMGHIEEIKTACNAWNKARRIYVGRSTICSSGDTN